MKRLIGILLFLASCTSAFSQYIIQGKVIDDHQQAVPYAAVALCTSADSSVVKGGITDDTGAYEIVQSSPGSYFVSVQHIGFQKLSSSVFTLSSEDKVVILDELMLKEDIQTLSEVTVKAQRPLVEQRVDRVVLNVENSVIAKGNKVIDLLEYVPLVQVDGGSIKVANRGSVLILIDGKQVGDAALQTYLQNFSAEDIVKIEVVTNPSAKYDASYRSVINVITKKSLDMGLKGRISLNYSQGQRGRFTPDASLTYRKNAWNIFSSLSYQQGNSFYEQKINRFFPNGSMVNQVEGVNQSTGLSNFTSVEFSPYDNHTFGLRLNGNWHHSRDEAENITSFFSTSSIADSLLNTDLLGRNNGQTYDLNVNYQGILDTTGQKVEVSFTQTYAIQDNDQNITYRPVSEEPVPMDESNSSLVSNPSQQRSSIVQIDYTLPTKKAQWEFGGRFFSIKNSNEVLQENFQSNSLRPISASFNADVYREQTYAAYTNYSHVLKERWNVQLGLRAEQTDQRLEEANISRSYFGLFPSAGVSRSFGEEYSWGVTYSRKISRPGLNSLIPFRYILDPYTWQEGNPALRPQYANVLDTYLNLGGVSFFLNYELTSDLINDIIYARGRTYWQVKENLDQAHSAYVGSNWSGNITPWWQNNSNFTVFGTHLSTAFDEIGQYTFQGVGLTLESTSIFTLPNEWKAELTLNYSSPSQWMMWETETMYWVTASINKEIFKRGNLRIRFSDIFRTRQMLVRTEYGPINLSSWNYNDNQRIQVSLSFNFGKKTVKEGREKDLNNGDIKSRMGN